MYKRQLDGFSDRLGSLFEVEMGQRPDLLRVDVELVPDGLVSDPLVQHIHDLLDVPEEVPGICGPGFEKKSLLFRGPDLDLWLWEVWDLRTSPSVNRPDELGLLFLYVTESVDLWIEDRPTTRPSFHPSELVLGASLVLLKHWSKVRTFIHVADDGCPGGLDFLSWPHRFWLVV